MDLLSDKDLQWSDIVANNRMNRSRNASGTNSYQQELKVKPEAVLQDYINKRKEVKWLDLCCGEGRALLQSAEWLAKRKMQDQATLLGIDLVDQFQPIPSHIHCVQFQITPLTEWTPSGRYDFITCIHGLHYLGDKLKVITAALAALSEDGTFIANFDLASIVVAGDPKGQYLRQLFRTHEIDYKSRSKMIMCKGPRKISMPLSYQGADDKAGPNYTGQPAVTSYYSK